MMIDAGVWISAFLADDPHHKVSRACLDGWHLAGGGITVPCHFAVEVAATIARRTGDAALAETAVLAITSGRDFNVENVEFNMVLSAGTLAAQLGLSTSEALYAGMAYQWGATLLTWDDSFIARASPKIKIRHPSLIDRPRSNLVTAGLS